MRWVLSLTSVFSYGTLENRFITFKALNYANIRFEWLSAEHLHVARREP